MSRKNDKKKKKFSGFGREAQLLSDYSLTLEAHSALLQSQDGKCKICKGVNINGRQLAVDHDHKTGRIRGLLCHHCNVLLGQAKENPTILLKAIQYLKGKL